MAELSLFVASVEGSTKQEKIDSVVDAMCSFSDTDCDFNGENGMGYLWNEAKAGDYESNLEYTADICRKANTPKEALFKFAEMWLEKDSYYVDYKVSYTVKDNSEDETDITSIAIAFCTGY